MKDPSAVLSFEEKSIFRINFDIFCCMACRIETRK